MLDLETTIHSRDRWRAGDAGQGFPELGPGETEALYAELIEQRAAQRRCAQEHLGEARAGGRYSASS